jgi:hypothetical protein
MNLGQSHVPNQAVERKTIERCISRADIAVERLSLVMFPVCLRSGQPRADEVQWIGPKAFMIDPVVPDAFKELVELIAIQENYPDDVQTCEPITFNLTQSPEYQE